MESPAANPNAASPAVSSPIVQPAYANPGQPPSAPVVLVGSPYYAQGQVVAQQQQVDNSKKKIWIVAIVVSIVVVVIPLIIILITTNRRDGPNAGATFKKPETVVEGIMFGTSSGVFLVPLPSTQPKQISSEPADSVSFDWNWRKVYWTNRISGATKRANLDGTDVEDVDAVGAEKLAVDSITGNVYYIKSSRNDPTHNIRVCSKSGAKCSTVVTDQLEADGLALYPSRSLMFWTTRTATYKADMDGEEATVILSKRVSYISINEDSDRLYWIDAGHKQIWSCDMNGNQERVHLKDPTGSLYGLAVHKDAIYFGNYTANRIQSVDKNGENPAVIADTTGNVSDVALYGSKKYFRENPCASSPCNHLFVLNSKSYGCLCAEGARRGKDGRSCG